MEQWKDEVYESRIRGRIGTSLEQQPWQQNVEQEQKEMKNCTNSNWGRCRMCGSTILHPGRVMGNSANNVINEG